MSNMNNQEQAVIMESEMNDKAIRQKSLKQFIIFGIVGVSNTIVDFVVFWVLIQLSLHYIIANIVAYGVGMLNSYFWNNKITFKSSRQQSDIIVARRIMRFIAWNGLMLLVSSVLIYAVIELLHWHALISKSVVIVVVLMFQFLGSKKWVFKQ